MNALPGRFARSAMSVSKHQESSCRHCNQQYTSGYDAQYCSERCFYREKGDTKLNLLRHDHRLCASCGAFVKEVDPPSEDWLQERQSMTERLLDCGAEYTTGETGFELDATDVNSGKRPTCDAIIGFQDSTPNATDVTREYGDSEYTVQNIIKTGLGCECGNADTSFVSKTLQNVDIKTVLVNYITTFWALEREGQLDQRLDKEVFLSSYSESRDLLYALGRGLHS